MAEEDGQKWKRYDPNTKSAKERARDAQFTRRKKKLLPLNLMIIWSKIYDIFDANHLRIMIDV